MIFLPGSAYAEVGPDKLTGEDKEHFDQFRYLFQNGTPDEFYAFAEEYEKELKEKKYMMLYYKLKNNEGYFALRHNMIFRAMQAAEELDNEMRSDGASDYYYLATGLTGDVYYKSHDNIKAEQYFSQALKEVGESDPKFTMRTCQSLAELLSLKDAERALEWSKKSLQLAKETGNTEYQSLALAMTAYIHFLEGNREDFFWDYDEYISLKSMEKPDFSHRYDNVVDIAKLAFHNDFDEALAKLKQGHIYVDSSLVALRIFTMEGDIAKSFGAMKRHIQEIDSIHSMVQSANFNQIASERALMRSQEEAHANKKLATMLVIWIIILTVIFITLYVWERRRLIRKIEGKNKDLLIALDKAEESDRMKSAFIRNMSHEVRTPLNAINGFSQLLCTPDYTISEADKQDMMSRITDNVQVITAIMDELLYMSQDESKHEREAVRVNTVCREAMAEYKARNTKGLDMKFETTLTDDVTVMGWTEGIKHMLSHLLDNALKFTAQGSITLQARQSGNQLLLSVSDTGIGIKPEDRQRVFDNFVKLSEYTGGVGLGLPICRRQAQALGGDVTLDESYAPGCRFVITLPA